MENIITKENLEIIKGLIPKIVYDELTGNLDIEDTSFVEVPSIEPVDELTIEDYKQSLEAAEISLEFADEKEKDSIQDYIDALKVQIELLEEQ